MHFRFCVLPCFPWLPVSDDRSCQGNRLWPGVLSLLILRYLRNHRLKNRETMSGLGNLGRIDELARDLARIPRMGPLA